MECDVCERPGRRLFYCEVCLNERLLIHNSALKRLSENHKVTVQRAGQLLGATDGIQERRLAKARRAAVTLHINTLVAQSKLSDDRAQSSKATLQAKKRDLATRQSRLREAQAQLQYRRSKLFSRSESPAPPLVADRLPFRTDDRSPSIPRQTALVDRYWDEVLLELVHVRRRLICQLCNIYPITLNNKQPAARAASLDVSQRAQASRQTDTSPASGKLEWRILGLCLPVSTEVESYPNEEVSAATLYASHLLRLAAMYLGIKLPFQMIMGPVLSIRAPRHSMWSNKHSSAYPLYLPPPLASGSKVAQVAFLTGLCMLAHNAHYLLASQQPRQSFSAEPARHGLPMHPKPTELLQNLHLCCHSRQLGSVSHATGKRRLTRPDDLSNVACMDLEESIKNVLSASPDDTADEEWSMI